ncbi:MAG: hypothetical protein ACLFTX_04485 [Thiohalospira sp.]
MLRLLGGAAVKWLGGGTLIALVLGGGGYLYHDWQTDRLHERVADLVDDRDQWRRSARTQQARADRLEQERVAARQAQQALREELQQQAQEYEALRKRIAAVPEADDAPAAPVLRRTLQELRP